LAALESIPILVSILYRFPAALPFLAAVAFVAMMPWLAITLTGSCILASLRPFRFQFRYASALLGLVLVLVYFYGAARTAAEPVDSLPNPAERIKFIAPWLLATVASCILMAFALLIARMVNYRPGAITPLLAVMFALPVAMFEFEVGRDELHYRIIEHDYGPGSAYFAAQDVSEEFEEVVTQAWLLRKPPRPPLEAVRDSSELLWELNLMGRYNTAIARYRQAAIGKIDWFLLNYPDSPYAVNALYLKARAMDVRAEQVAFRHEKMLRFYADFPAESSRHTWRMVYENGPRTPMAAVALVRLAQLDARSGDLDQARERLRILDRSFGRGAQESEPAGGLIDTVLTRKPVEQTLSIVVDRYLLEGRRLLDLLTENRDPLYGNEPAVWMLRCDPKSEHYRDNLRKLTKRYPAAQITDNAELEIALATPGLAERIAQLQRCVGEHPNGDAVTEGLYRLGEAYGEIQESARAREYYEQVIRDHPDSIWRQPAEENLRVLPPAP
jgi:TolA-binding protein